MESEIMRPHFDLSGSEHGSFEQDENHRTSHQNVGETVENLIGLEKG